MSGVKIYFIFLAETPFAHNTSQTCGLLNPVSLNQYIYLNKYVYISKILQSLKRLDYNGYVYNGWLKNNPLLTFLRTK